jgi:23S rRNA (adenine2030-N6)-methyltransferase
MNYRHAYHAGNHGDVLKHAVLAWSILRLHDKPSPLFILDTHAGIGGYDLEGVEAAKTGEWQSGIGPLLAADPPALKPYLDIVRSLNPDGALKHYPGSPEIAAAAMRPGDRLVLCELHPEDADTLRGWARGRTGIAVHHRDGYESLKAFLPPKEGRGLVLVDPAFEAVDEYQRLAAAVSGAYRRWPGGRWLIWHPVKDRAPVWQLEESLLANGVETMLSVELVVRPVDGVSLAGSGLILINPVFGLEDYLARTLPEIARILSPEHGSHALKWIGA